MSGQADWKVACWPSKPLPHPDPDSRARWRLHPLGGFELEHHDPIQLFDSTHEQVAPFDEIYLLLYALDLDDEEAVVSFTNEFGPLEIYKPFVDERSIRTGAFARAPYPALSAYPGFDDLDDYDERSPLLEASDAARAEIADLKNIDLGVAPAPPTIQEFRWAARCMKDLVRTYRCLSEGRSPAEFSWENPVIAFDVEGQKRGDPGAFWTADGEMGDFLSDTLALGLADFSPRIVLREDIFPRRPRDWAEQFAAGNDLWAVCCLELFNHIAEGAQYKDCANELCGRPFVRQVGRAVHGQRRVSGVRFCSHTCARAQAQRDYARRKRTQSRPRATNR
jgi:hypothetical protein